MAQSVTKSWANPSSPCAAIAATANARAVQRTSLPPASPARGSASSRAHQSAMLRKRTAVTTLFASFCGDCGTPLYVQVGTRPDLSRTSRLHPGRRGLVQARCRHLHEKRTTLGPRPAQRPEARRLPARTVLPDRAVPRWIVIEYCDARLGPTSVTPPISQQVLSRAGLTEMGG